MAKKKRLEDKKRQTPESEIAESSRIRLTGAHGYVPDFEAYERQLRHADNVVEEKPSYVVDVPDGERLLFFVDEHDGGVTVLGETPSYSKRASALDHPDLQAATPAGIYHAVTDDDAEMPELLTANHDAIVREHALTPTEAGVEGRSRGWFVAQPAIQQSSPCNNATFHANHCETGANYDNSACIKNTSANNAAYFVNGAYRYKAGFCLQQGQAQSWLTYEHVRWNDQQGWCESCNVLHFSWGLNSLLFGEKYSATTYRVLIYWKPSSTVWGRNYVLAAGHGTGDLYDLGQRWSRKNCKYFT